MKNTFPTGLKNTFPEGSDAYVLWELLKRLNLGFALDVDGDITFDEGRDLIHYFAFICTPDGKVLYGELGD